MFHHHTKTKGDIGLIKAKCDLMERGFLVLSPETEHAPFDLVIYRDGIFQTVQVKFRAATNGFIDVPLSTSWADRNGSHTRAYDKAVVDIMCAYCPDTGGCYYFSTVDTPGHRVRLRLKPAANNQAIGVRLASEHRQVPWPVVNGCRTSV